MFGSFWPKHLSDQSLRLFKFIFWNRSFWYRQRNSSSHRSLIDIIFCYYHHHTFTDIGPEFSLWLFFNFFTRKTKILAWEIEQVIFFKQVGLSFICQLSEQTYKHCSLVLSRVSEKLFFQLQMYHISFEEESSQSW